MRVHEDHRGQLLRHVTEPPVPRPLHRDRRERAHQAGAARARAAGQGALLPAPQCRGGEGSPNHPAVPAGPGPYALPALRRP